MRVIVAGGRKFKDYDLLCQKLDIILSKITNIEIISGCANGADKLGERYAGERKILIKRFPADWSRGRGAGYARNIDMGLYADALILFWDGKSKGSEHMLQVAEKEKLLIRIINY